MKINLSRAASVFAKKHYVVMLIFNKELLCDAYVDEPFLCLFTTTEQMYSVENMSLRYLCKLLNSSGIYCLIFCAF